MALLAAHFDKSGAEDEPLVAVAGFIATDFKWDVLGEKWKEVLREFEVEDFHMSQFFRNGKDFPLKDWPESRKDKFMRRLTKIVNDYTQQQIGHAVTRKAIFEADLGSSKKYVGNQYQLACFLCIQGCAVWAKEKDALRERVDFVFDNDGKFYNPALTAYGVMSKSEELVRKHKIGNIAFSDRHCSAGVQAADMFAFLILEYQRRHLVSKRARPHKYLTWLLQRSDYIQSRGQLIDSKIQVERWGKGLSEI